MFSTTLTFQPFGMVNPPYSISLSVSRGANANIGCMRIVSWITCHVYFIFRVSSQHSKSPTFSIAIFFCSITCTSVNLQFQLNGISWQTEKDKIVLKWHSWQKAIYTYSQIITYSSFILPL